MEKRKNYEEHRRNAVLRRRKKNDPIEVYFIFTYGIEGLTSGLKSNAFTHGGGMGGATLPLCCVRIFIL